MDLSKLPRLSQTEQPPPPAAPVAAPPAARPTAGEPPAPQQPPLAQPTPAEQERVVYVEHVAPGGPEAWISMAMGMLFLLMIPHTLTYASSKLFGTTFAPWPDPTQPYPAKCDFKLFTDGTKIFYRDSPDFWSDLFVTCFAVVLIFDGLIILWVRKRLLIMAAFTMTILVVLLNLGYLIKSMSGGLAMLSAVAVTYGVYIAIFQWRLLDMLKQRHNSAG